MPIPDIPILKRIKNQIYSVNDVKKNKYSYAEKL